jgi:hypothetical protein
MEDSRMCNQKNRQVNGRMKNDERTNNGRMKNDEMTNNHRMKNDEELRKDGRYQHRCLSFRHFSFDHWFVCSSDYLCWYLPSFLSPVVIFHSAIDLFVLLITHAREEQTNQWSNEK